MKYKVSITVVVVVVAAIDVVVEAVVIVGCRYTTNCKFHSYDVFITLIVF